MALPVSLALFLSFSASISVMSQSTNFTYNGFHEAELVLDGTATILRSSGAIMLTDSTRDVQGHAFYPNPIQFLNSSSHKILSFSTSFVFAIVSSGSTGGYGLAFTLSPSSQLVGAEAGHYLGLLNSTNNGNDSNHMFAVEFDTVSGFLEKKDVAGNHVGINLNSMDSVASQAAQYSADGPSIFKEMRLDSGDAIQAWIDYDGVNAIISVTIAPKSTEKPTRPLLSEKIDLTDVLKDQMYVGFSAATGVNKSSSHYILGWSFRVNGVADRLDLTKLPVPPSNKKDTSSYKPGIEVIMAVISLVLVLLLVSLCFIVIHRRRMAFESLEEWETELPHRFKYQDLYAATKGFRESELLGAGGSGAVYRGVLLSTGVEVAVKKITSNNTLQRMREFAAEIESLGRLRHKNIVNLQGWCKKKNELLLVYDYVPNGNLHSLLFDQKNNRVLSWEQRFNIINGIAAGLLYLHEEWEKVVIHRDVKSSNVLIDADMNGRLGDFGLARLYDHEKNSYTTNLVGTIGYIAPELTQTGKASTSSDVFAFGVLLLEVACGKKAIINDPSSGPVILVNWVIECLQNGRLLEAADPKLNSSYDSKEVELVLRLGILCSHPEPKARPGMREIFLYLHGEQPLPISEKIGPIHTRFVDPRTMRFLEMIGDDTHTSSYSLTSTGGMSRTRSF